MLTTCTGGAPSHDPCTWSEATRRRTVEASFAAPERDLAWWNLVKAHSCIADDALQRDLVDETLARLEREDPWGASKRVFRMANRLAYRRAGSTPSEINPALGLVRHLVAYQVSYQHGQQFFETLRSRHAPAIEGISYTPHSRGDEITTSILAALARSELRNLRHLSYRGGDLGTAEDLELFLRSESAQTLESLHFGGREQVLWFGPLARAAVLPQLRALSFSVSSTLDLRDAPSFLGSAPLGRVRHLAVHDGAPSRNDHVLAGAIGRNRALAELRELRLTAHDRFADAGRLVDALIASPYLAQLEVLCLSIQRDEHGHAERLRRAAKFRSTRVITSGSCPTSRYRWDER